MFGYTVVHQEIGGGVIIPVSIPWKIMSKTTWWDIETLQEMVADGSLVPTRSVVMRAQSERIPVSPPPRRNVGRPTTDPSIWRAVINS